MLIAKKVLSWKAKNGDEFCKSLREALLKKIKVVCPTRVDLSGGTLDLWPIYNFILGAKTINMAIDIFTTCSIEESSDNLIHIQAPGIQLDRKIENLSKYLEDEKNKSDFYYPHLKYFQPPPCKIHFSSESPVGGGLGGSSSLTISIFKALAAFTDNEIQDVSKMVQIAHNMESFLLNTPTGIQDYYPAALGGTLCLHHHWNGTKVEKLNLATDIIKENFLLVYTGSPHHSGMNNWAVLKALIDGDRKTKRILEEISNITDELYEAIRSQSWEDVPVLFQKEFEQRTNLSESFTSDKIQELDFIAKKFGADAIKICGAGGGGCVFLWAKKEKHSAIKKVLQEKAFQVLEAKPCEQGAQVSIDEN